MVIEDYSKEWPRSFEVFFILAIFEFREFWKTRLRKKYTRFQLRVVINTSVNGKLRNRWNISILSSRFVQFPPFPERGIYAPRANAYTPGQVLLTPVRQRNKNPYGVIGIMLLSPCDGEFRTNCIVRGGITIARGKITSFNSVFRVFLIHSQH